MAASTKFTEPIPDRRRTRFPLNGGPRPTAADRRRARRGLRAAREALAAADPSEPQPAIVAPMAAGDIAVARRGIAAAREALSA